AKEIVLESLRPLGKDYTGTVRAGIEERWIDVYENEGKTSGAYSWGCYDTHPYILMNYESNIDSLFTLAHEMGHSMHTYLSNRTQPYITAGYKIFVAEVASILNEILLTEYLLKIFTDKKKKAFVLNHYLEQFRGTVYRQAMFAEFEKIIHDNAEKCIPLTVDSLNNIYHDLNLRYYGDGIVLDEMTDLEWARIPHFYSAFYVYKYAIGFSAGAALSKNILGGDKKAVKNYINFLSSGGSDYPINLLRGAGVDMASPQPIREALKIFGNIISEIESLLS
ncbi:MAG: oligoendopeptidase F family protein, partial [Actinobacteria bacterium]|nr:oligoendopeptidase F family protein [Actinomycetota bacterium]